MKLAALVAGVLAGLLLLRCRCADDPAPETGWRDLERIDSV